MLHLDILVPVLAAADPELVAHMPEMQPFVALPATLTLFAHVVEDYSLIARLFDFFLANEAVVPIYLFAAVWLPSRRLFACEL